MVAQALIGFQSTQSTFNEGDLTLTDGYHRHEHLVHYNALAAITMGGIR